MRFLTIAERYLALRACHCEVLSDALEGPIIENELLRTGPVLLWNSQANPSVSRLLKNEAQSMSEWSCLAELVWKRKARDQSGCGAKGVGRYEVSADCTSPARLYVRRTIKFESVCDMITQSDLHYKLSQPGSGLLRMM
jgi:hypothetical protein